MLASQGARCNVMLRSASGLAEWRDTVDRYGNGLGVESDRTDLTGTVLKADLAGATLMLVTSGPQLMRRTRVAKGFSFGPTAIIQIAGDMKLRQGDRSCALSSGSFAYVDIASPHEVEYSDDFQVLALQFPINTFRRDAFMQASGITMDGTHPLNAPFYDCAISLWKVAEAIHPLNHSSALTALVALSHITTTISGIETEVAQPIRMVRAMQYIEHHLSDPDLSAQKVADAQGVSRRYLDTLFSSHNHRVQTWIWERRLLRAAEDLRLNTEWRHTILQSALDHGFKTPSHFSRAFAKRFGVPPREFRKQHGISQLNS